MIDRRLLANVDWVLVGTVLIICLTGIFMVYSATHTKIEGTLSGLSLRQLYWLGYGLAGLTVLLFLDYRLFQRYGYLIFFLSLLLLILLPITGRIISGAQRWLTFGPLRVQPAEFAKLALILALAKYLSETSREAPLGLRDLALPACLIGVPALLVAAQPDLGSALMLIFLGGSILVVAGLRRGTLLTLALGGMSLAPIGWFFLKGYQKQRILTVFGGGDPLGAGYQSLQSKIAVGSGGIWGKGLLAGTQSQLHFLPEQHTDFLFAVFAEELGFLAVAALLALYCLLIVRGAQIAYRSRDLFGALVALGVVASIGLQTILNVAMTTGLIPIVGLPLPFMSYGGSALVSQLLGVGLLLSIRMRRFINY